jgi:hypothetical protein
MNMVKTLMSFPKALDSFQNQLFNKIFYPLAFASTASLVASAPAQALQFNFTYAPDTTIEQIAGFEMAGRIWSNYIKDDVTVNIHVEMVEGMPNDVLGGALTGWQAREKYEDFVDAMDDDRSSTDDYNAFSNLTVKKDGKKFSAFVDERLQIKDLEKINITNANAKALGMLYGQDTDLDGYIVLNNNSNWSYGLKNGVPDNQLDYLSVATHEIGHILGFASGIDDPGWLQTMQEVQETIKDCEEDGDDKCKDLKIDKKEAEYFTPLDQFRYSQQSAKTYNESIRDSGFADLSIGGDKYFSLDRGKTALGYFSTGEVGGDGEQASHWQDRDNPLGIMSPLLNAGSRRDISWLDMRAFDVIGWDTGNTWYALSQGDLDRFYNEAWATANQKYNQESWRFIKDRENEVQDMIDDSQIYEWGTGGSGGSPYCTPYYPCNRVWQKYAIWQKIKPAAVPENSSTVVPIAFGLLGILIRRKIR